LKRVLAFDYVAAHILRLEKAGKLPRCVQLGKNRIGWLLIHIEGWISSRTPTQIFGADAEQPATV
jgi:predicted DNA-binding transcriptional regulator AlpA